MIDTLTGKQIGQLVKALLSAYPERDELRIMVTVELEETLDAIAGGANQRTVIYNLVTWAQSKGRISDLLAGALRGNPGNPILSALVKDWQELMPSDKVPLQRGQEQGRRQRAQERHIAEVELELERNWVNGVAELALILEISSTEVWGEDLCQQLDRLQRRLCSPGRLNEYLRRVGALFRQHEDIMILHRQLESAICFGDQYSATLAPFLTEYNIHKPGLSHLAHLFALWEEFLYDAWDVIAAFTHDTLERVPNANELIANEMSFDGRKWLRMHPRLRGIIKLPPLDIYKDWPTFGIPDGDGLQHSDAEWLNTHSLSKDPFASIGETEDRDDEPELLHWVRIVPDWFTRLKKRSSIIIADSFADGVAWAVNIPGQYLISGVFTIAGIPDPISNDAPDVHTLLDIMCQIAAERWLDLIAANSNALLAQSSNNIDMLFELLIWHCTDLEFLLRRLGVYTAAPTMENDERRLKLLVEAYVRQRWVQQQRLTNPSQARRIEWLSIRAPGLDEEANFTVIIMLLPSSFSLSLATSLGNIAQRLRKRRVIFHLVVERPTVEYSRPLRCEPLSWKDEEIQAMIDARITAAGAPNGPQTFSDLTDDLSLGDTSPYAYLLEAAQGSLHRALGYCRLAVEIHQKSGASDWFSEETLRRARDEVNRDES